MPAIRHLIRFALLLACCAWTQNLQAQARTLHWQSFDVEATLDSDGRLHVRETQAIVFTGAWNGGERHFRVRRPQRLDFISLDEFDPATGIKRAFVNGSLASIGEYRWADDHLLRWRSRMATDPPFNATVRVYELSYVLSNILVQVDGGYVLDHDFAFADRSGTISDFTRTLHIDPVWQAGTPFEETIHVDRLAPGQGEVERIVLQYVGMGQPNAVTRAPSKWLQQGSRSLGQGLVAGLALLAALYFFLGSRYERARGRLNPLVPVDAIDAAWLNENVLKYPAEVVGGAWDRETSTHEVAAVLARMTVEGKLASEVRQESAAFFKRIFKREVLHLELLCDHAGLKGYEAQLVAALFLGDRTTDTDKISRHYREDGFNPMDLIRSPLQQKVNSLLGPPQKLAPLHWQLTALLVIAGIAACAIGAFLAVETLPFVAITAGAIAFFFMLAKVSARRYRLGPVGIFGTAVQVAVYVTIALAVLTWAFLGGTFMVLSAIEFIGLAILMAGLINSVHNTMLTLESPAAVAIRNRLMSARRYFERELRSQSPRLKDEWLPYILGFGLGPRVDRWFRVYGQDLDDVAAGSRPAYNTSACASGWTGGGGMFGGGGASGTWVAAVGGIAAGVSAASSDSGGGGSSSGGGGGGGSSGGGGGGGW